MKISSIIPITPTNFSGRISMGMMKYIKIKSTALMKYTLLKKRIQNIGLLI
jgi:hypothetical protein